MQQILDPTVGTHTTKHTRILHTHICTRARSLATATTTTTTIEARAPTTTTVTLRRRTRPARSAGD
jgi:hypothetical protein